MIRHKTNELSSQKCQGFTLIELIVVIVVIGLLAATGIAYYGKTLDDAKRTGVEILANRFSAAIALVRGQWIVESTMQLEGRVPKSFRVVVDETPIFLNPLGWPANTNGDSASLEDQTAEECAQIWHAIMQNPAAATVEGRVKGDSLAAAKDPESKGKQRYHISQVGGHKCRYELVTKPGGTHYFDYNLKTGQVLVTVPPMR